ncbi:hypothetical protein EJB05_00039 [Eragrostis curvula]|uniref:Yippee domain-containing protein n=1 Tax=Eragrostis curvula TaxID=38414 RepID=A0A5J9WLL5_9POAL|nr:hypothetical protein EJB05_00039 [Eragrostis curvula]
MGRLFLVSLPATGDIIYRCKHCDTQLAYAADIISKMFRCKHGKAYLFDKIVNVNVGDKDDRMMTTGMHSVCDIFCVTCGSILGWKYLAAFEKNERYKEGKFILESKQSDAKGKQCSVKDIADRASFNNEGARWWALLSLLSELICGLSATLAPVRARKMTRMLPCEDDEDSYPFCVCKYSSFICVVCSLLSWWSFQCLGGEWWY